MSTIQIIKSHLFLSLLLTLSLSSFGQDTEEEKKENDFGSPDQVDRQLASDKAVKKPFFELDFLNSYFDFKDRLNKNIGLNFGMDYSAAAFSVNESLGEDNASSGMFRFYGSWELVGKESGNTGAFIFKIEHRHKYGAIAPKSLGFEIGYIGLIDPPFNDEKFRVTNFYWRQRLAGGRIELFAGLLDATDYVDVYAMASPWMHFTNFAFSTGSQTMFVPNDATLGLAIAGYVNDHIYAIVGINDTNSDPTKPFKSFETFFSQGQYFKSVEIGWVTSKERYFFDNLHLLYWHSDGSEFQGSPAGWGLNFSGSWFFQDKFMPFLRGGYSEDGGSLLQKSITAGLGWYQSDNSHLLGAAIGWGEVNESTWTEGLDDQITIEMFYRLQVSSRLAVTPTLQYLINPALNPDASSIFLWGLRGRLSL